MALDDAEEAKLRDELAQAKDALKRVNGESAGRRATIDRMTTEADERRAELEALRTEAAANVEVVRTEFTGKLTAAEQAAAERTEAARKKVMQADLRIAAKDAGMVDLDALTMLPPDQLKLDDEGSVTNAAEALAAFKKAKPYAFGQPTTSSTANPPVPDPAAAATKKFKDMTESEQAEFRRRTGVT